MRSLFTSVRILPTRERSLVRCADAEGGRPLRHELREIHNWIGWTIIVIAALHAAAALYHHYALRDRVLKRMLPARLR